MNTLLVAATSAFLFVAPFAGSAGLRATMLILAAIAVAAGFRRIAPALDAAPRAVIVTFAAWALLATASVAWSVQPKFTLAELRAEIVYGALALAIFYFAAFENAQRWRTWILALLAGSAALLASIELDDVLPFINARHTVLEQRGPWSTHLVLAAPIVCILGMPRPWGDGRAAWIQAAALALLLLASWQTGSRMMWVAFGAQLVVALAIWRATPAMQAAWPADLRRVALASGAIVAMAFAASMVEHNERFFGAEAPMRTSLERDLRPQIWSTAVHEIGKAPWLGNGFGREIVAPAFVPLTPRVHGHPELRHAHNVFLDVVLELGIVGLAVFVAMLVALAREYRGYLRRVEVAPLGLLGLTLLAGFVVKNLTDDFMHRHNALVFWALNGALIGLARSARAPR